MGLSARLSDPAGWDWGTVPDWLVLVTAVIGAVLALRQLGKAAEANRDEWRIQQGIQLMQIDDKYEVTLQESRKAFARLQWRCETAADGLPLPERVSSELTGLFNASRKRGPFAGTPAEVAAVVAIADRAVDEYFVLMQLPNYLETIGVMTAEGLVSEDTVLKLYGTMLSRVIGNIIPHITHRRQTSPDFLIYAEALGVKARARTTPR